MSVVSIPSSRVGTPSSRTENKSHARFHPLKSGRDKSFGLNVVTKSRVSIPSSRVGTCPSTTRNCLSATFPSPQVGSGLDMASLISNLTLLVSIPSSRVGTPSGSTAPGSGSAVSIPSSRVGTVEAHGGGPVDVSFHPLKSGRDEERDSLVALAATFPSPQVGSGPIVGEKP